MKKALLSFLAFIALVAQIKAQNSGVFIGVQGGVSLDARTSSISASSPVDSAYYSTSVITADLMYGARLGYILAFNEKNALRFYGEFSAGEFTYNTNASSYNMRAGGGLDYIFSFGEVYGLYLGAGYDYTFGKFMRDAGSLGNPHLPFVNLGMAWNVSILRIELGAKVPVMRYYRFEIDAIDNNTGAVVGRYTDTAYTPAQFYLNVDFVF